jgi:glycosyltransferase involved in cell wall biosynthesis
MDNFPGDIDFIFITQTRWDGVPSTSYAIALEIAKTQRVFFIDKPYTWKDMLSWRKNAGIRSRSKTYFLGKERYRSVTGLPEKFQAVVSYLILPVNWLSPGPLYRFFLNRNRKRMESLLSKLVEDRGIKRYVLFNSFNPLYPPDLKIKLKPLVSIYQSVDNMAAAHYLSKHGPYLELEVTPKADMLLATSKDIIERFKKHGFKFDYLPNAANVEIFSNAYFSQSDRPAELRNINKPVIGYLGGIDSRTDYDLIVKLSRSNPDKMIVMIGPKVKVDDDRGIAQLPNVMLISFKKMHELPSYVKYFDCAIIPFVYNEFTRSVYPLKVNEYLAAGRPVVTTRFSEDISAFETIAYVCDDHDSFVTAVGKAISENTKEKELARIDYARNNSWLARAEELKKMIMKFGVARRLF